MISQKISTMNESRMVEMISPNRTKRLMARMVETVEATMTDTLLTTSMVGQKVLRVSPACEGAAARADRLPRPRYGS